MRNRKEIKRYVNVFLLSFLPKAILCFFMYPVSVLSDEVATIAGATLLTSYDWSSVISHAGYYGTGMSILVASLFWITDNPIVIYRGIGLLATFMQSITAVIGYSILKRNFKIKNQAVLVIISVVASYLVAVRGILIFNEHALILVAWVIAWILMKLQDESSYKKQKIIYTVALTLLLTYSLTLHTRSILLWIAVGFAIVFYAWTYRKCLISIPTSVVFGGIGYVVAEWYVHIIQKEIWLVDDASQIHNTTITTSGQFSLLFDSENWRAWANIVLGQLHTVGIMTGGILILAALFVIHLLWRSVFFRKRFLKESGEEVQYLRAAYPVLIFCVAFIVINIAGQSISWLGDGVGAINSGYWSDAYGVKGFTYVRYLAPTMGPLFLVFLGYAYQCREKVLIYMKPALAALCVLEFYWMVCIVPYLVHNTQQVALEFYFPFSFQKFTDDLSIKIFFPPIFFTFGLFFLFWWGLQKRKIQIPIGILAVGLIYSYIFLGVTWDLAGERKGYAHGNAGYELLHSIQDEVELPKEITVQDIRNIGDHQNWFIYQILLNRYKILPATIEDTADTISSDIVFSNDVAVNPELEGWTDLGEYDAWIEKGYKYCILDENEVMFVKGEKLQQEFESQGVKLLEK